MKALFFVLTKCFNLLVLKLNVTKNKQGISVILQ